MRPFVMATLIVTGTAAPVFAQECRFEATRSATQRASADEILDLIAGPGSLTVHGRDGVSEVRVIGHACASSEDLLDQVRLETSSGGSRIHVEMPEIHDGSFRRDSDYYYRMDLEIEVPRGMAAHIRDGSGGILIDGLGRLDLEDGSGDIELRDIAGDLVIDDGSGAMTIDHVIGSIRIDDGSGDVGISGVEGDVEVDDGSGGISIRNVKGNVDVDDGSGSIDVRDITGDFVVGSDGSGGIRHSNVAGRVDIPRRRHRHRQR